MRCLAICHRGFEDVTSDEVEELLNKKTEIHESCVEFETDSIEQIAMFCYKAQSISRAILLLDNFKGKIIDDVVEHARMLKLDNWLKGKSFVVRCLKDESDLYTTEIESSVGEVIFENVKAKVSLKNPDIIFFVYIFRDMCYFGIDFCGFDLSKRDYKIFSGAASLKGTVAYSLVKLSGFTGKEVLIDPFCGSGTIPIEAALFAKGVSVNHFRKDKFAFNKFLDIQFEDSQNKKANVNAFDKTFNAVSGAKKNAKIASIHKEINFSRLDVEWLDTKFDKESVDKIVTDVPRLSKYANKKEIEKVYNEFLYQAEFVLKKEGRIVILTNKKEEIEHHAEKYKFNIEEARDVWLGKEKNVVLILTRKCHKF